MKDLKVIGMMSGTSLDGVDLAFCTFFNDNYSIEKCTTVKYSDEWKNRLRSLETASAVQLAFEHSAFGEYLGELAKEFIGSESVDFISSHGHTIFHQPDRRFTFQLGSGAAIAAVSGFPVVCDFRSKDVALNGQGAPLVPIGDELLFNDYDYCLNLGGIANISFNKEGKRIAFDICPVNLVLNELAAEYGLEYDDKGQLASAGKVNEMLLNQLNNLAYYSLKAPKSLGRETIVDSFLPLISEYNSSSLEDRLHTFCVHIAQQISGVSNFSNGERMLITGGGAYNSHLIEDIRKHVSCKVVIPSNEIIEFKEALIFAFLGKLRWEEKNNALSSVTGALRDSCGGCIYK